jgi:hypothetical protein
MRNALMRHMRPDAPAVSSPDFHFFAWYSSLTSHFRNYESKNGRKVGVIYIEASSIGLGRWTCMWTFDGSIKQVSVEREGSPNAALPSFTFVLCIP